MKRYFLVHVAVVAFIAAAGFAAASWQDDDAAQACGAAGPFDFDTYEPENFQRDYSRAIELATRGQAVTFSYTDTTGQPVDVRYQGLLAGPRSNRSGLSTARAIPPTIYKSIAWIEANWANASNAVPYGGVGPVLRSFDCGYGIGQITSGMGNATGTPTGKQAVIGTHFMFNIAEGMRILADKWNSAPQYRPIAGNGDPNMIEDWYYAIWSYNGFAFSNHPLNPDRDPLRGGGGDPIYHCWDPAAPGYQVRNGAVVYGYGSYTYPERVYGCMRYPPVKNGVRMWPAQTFNMPDFSLPEVAAPFSTEHFSSCAASSQCAAMDFPTTIQREGVNVTPHADTTPPPDLAWVGQLLGDPHFSYDGPNFIALTAYDDGSSTSGTVRVSNVGSYVAPFRVRTSAPWIVVRHPGDSASRTLDGGVAVGRDTEVVVTANPRLTQSGYTSNLLVTLDTSTMPAGIHEGAVWIEPLLGGGGVFRVDIIAANGASSFPNKLIIPGMAAGD